MSYIRFQPNNVVTSIDSVTMPTWTSNQATLTSFFTGSSSPGFEQFYTDVYQENATGSNAESQFAVAYGHISGSGSTYFNDLVPYYSATRTVFGQYRTLIFGSENAIFNFGLGTTSNNCGLSTTNGTPSRDIYVINVNRNRYKQHLMPGSFNLVLSNGGATIQLTDNSKIVTTNTYLDCGRAFDIVSGSYGTPVSESVASGVVAGYTPSGSYGMFLPDIGVIVLNPRALALTSGEGGISLIPDESYDTAAYNQNSLLTTIQTGARFDLNSEESIASNYVFVRIENQDCNYTTNPSIIDDTGELVYSSFINNPQTYITTIGLFNDNNELLAVAKTSKPIVKDFTREALFRIKLDW